MANFLIVGDAPNTHSGLARIAKDISSLLVGDGHQVTFLGLGWQWGWEPATDPGYPVFAIRDGAEFGQRDVLEHVYRLTSEHEHKSIGDNAAVLDPTDSLILFFIWDPSRCASAIDAIRTEQKRGQFANVKIWGYYAVDAEGPGQEGSFTGPAALAVINTDRILAYTEFGASVLDATWGRTEVKNKRPKKASEHLPHGLSAPFVGDVTEYDTNDYVKDKEIRRWALQHRGRILGAVATNQPRKDLPLLFEAAALARDAKLIDALWLHTDQLFGHYSIPLFCEAFGWIGGDNLLITVPDQDPGAGDQRVFNSKWKLNADEELASMYQACRVTMAPGLGEGWGYPIVESLALGVPCVGVAYAGGSDLIPVYWKIDVDSWRWDGKYCLKRPVMTARDTLAALTGACQAVEGFARSLGQKWAWSKIWPELWRPWIEAGLR